MKKTDIDLLTIHKLEINQYKESTQILTNPEFSTFLSKEENTSLKNLLSLNHFSVLIENN